MKRDEGQDDRELRDRLRALRVDPPAEPFLGALHRRLASAGVPDRPGLWQRLWSPAPRGSPWVWPAFAGAGVAAVLVFALFRTAPPSPVGRPVTVASAELPATKVAVVRMNLTAEVAVESAHIRISLPDGLVFWADGKELAQRSFEWTQPLHAGDNDIPIAVRGSRPGQYRMTLTANIGKDRVEDDVLIQVIDG